MRRREGRSEGLSKGSRKGRKKRRERRRKGVKGNAKTCKQLLACLLVLQMRHTQTHTHT